MTSLIIENEDEKWPLNGKNSVDCFLDLIFADGSILVQNWVQNWVRNVLRW